jgi:hypothetical protein
MLELHARVFGGECHVVMRFFDAGAIRTTSAGVGLSEADLRATESGNAARLLPQHKAA